MQLGRSCKLHAFHTRKKRTTQSYTRCRSDVNTIPADTRKPHIPFHRITDGNTVVHPKGSQCSSMCSQHKQASRDVPRPFSSFRRSMPGKRSDVSVTAWLGCSRFHCLYQVDHSWRVREADSGTRLPTSDLSNLYTIRGGDV